MVPPLAVPAPYGTQQPALADRSTTVSEPEHIEQLGLPDLDVASDGDDDLENQSGLGKGLSAIIPRLAGLGDDDHSPRAGGGLASLIPGAGAPVDDPMDEGSGEPVEAVETEEPVEAEEPVDDTPPLVDTGSIRQLRDDLVRALLDGLVNTMRLDLCAYVHQESDGEPVLFLRAPALATLGPQRAWTLFAALREATARERSDDGFDVAGLRGLVVATGGARSTGVFALARVGDLTDRERSVAARFCSSFGRAVHQLAGDRLRAAEVEDTAVAVEVHEARDSILARVQVEVDGRRLPGSGRADTRVEAVTRAVLDAHPAGPTFRYASEVAHGGEHAAVVLLESPAGAVALGSAVGRDAGSRATAHAAVRAVAGLSAVPPRSLSRRTVS